VSRVKGLGLMVSKGFRVWIYSHTCPAVRRSRVNVPSTGGTPEGVSPPKDRPSRQVGTDLEQLNFNKVVIVAGELAHRDEAIGLEVHRKFALVNVNANLVSTTFSTAHELFFLHQTRTDSNTPNYFRFSNCFNQ
jgi:hypothetical protein